jgi:hypothetical protein
LATHWNSFERWKNNWKPRKGARPWECPRNKFMPRHIHKGPSLVHMSTWIWMRLLRPLSRLGRLR